MVRARAAFAALLALAAIGFAALPCAAEDPETRDPFEVLDLGLESSVDVRLVTVDVVVLDRDDRTVAGLGVDDFVLYIDGKEASIETFDVACAFGGADEPTALPPGKQRPTTPEMDGSVKRFVLAIDYYHLGVLARNAALSGIYDLISRRLAGDEEIMLVALANGVRVEQPFTSDPYVLLAALRRMELDISLWNGNFRHSTERPIFEGLGAILEVLSQIDGPKAFVLFSDGNWPPPSGIRAGFDYDREFQKLAAMAGNARVTLYPVAASGLFFEPPEG